jgi:hypothetical protein
MRKLIPGLVSLLILSTTAFAQYPLGAFARFAKYPEGGVTNGLFTAYVERGVKLEAFLPQPAGDGTLGAPGFAGFFTLAVDGKPAYQSITNVGDGTRTLACDDWHTVVAKDGRGWRETMEVSQGYPFVWLTADLDEAPAAGIEFLVLGWDWANLKPPDEAELILDLYNTTPTKVKLAGPTTDILPVGRMLGAPLILLKLGDAPYRLALVPAVAPNLVQVRGGDLSVRLPHQDGQAMMAAAIVPAAWSFAEVQRLLPTAFAKPTSRKMDFGAANGKPTVGITTTTEAIPNSWAIKGQETVVLPPDLADRAPATALRFPTLLGDVAFVPGHEFTATLDPVAHISDIEAPAARMKPEWQAKMNAYAAAMCDRLRGQGGFTSSGGRTFYDGLTCSGLMSARPYLTPENRKRVDEAVGRTLDLWWEGLRQDGETGIWNFPEPVPGKPIIDYPEISATILWPTVQYAAAVKPEYARSLVPKLARLAPSMARAYDWNGAAYAYPGIEFTHIITESVTGGFVAWCAMNRLATMADEPKLAAEYAARAALAKESMKLLRWRKEYPAGGIVSEIFNGRIKTKITDAWCYTMYTWFTYVPAFELPREDIYNVWSTLDRERWWLYSDKSKQRCYDFAHAMAIARTFGVPAALEKLPIYEDRPFTYEHFDGTPVYALMAYPWLAGG